MRVSSRPVAALITAGSALAALALAAGPAQASHATGPRLTGAVLSNGRGITGATVQEFAMPNSAVLATLHKGDTVPMLTLGTAVTGASGAFTIPLGTIPASYRTTGDHNVNVQTQVFSGEQHTEYMSALPNAQTTSATEVSSEVFDLGARTVIDSNGITASAKPQALPVVTASAAVRADTPDGQPSCHNYDTGGRAQHHEAYGISNGNPYVWANLEEYIDHDHTVGIAADFGDGWSASGDASVTITGKYDDDGVRHGYSSRRANTLNWDEYGQVCRTINGGETRTYWWQSVSTADLDDLAQNVGNVKYAYCYYRENGESFTYGNGLKVSDGAGSTVEGVALTVEDTWSTDIAVHFLYEATGEFCGDNSQGTTHSPHFDGDAYGDGNS